MDTVTTIDSPQADQPLSYRLHAARRPETNPQPAPDTGCVIMSSGNVQ
ncbi:hypothetical protein [Streptomyces sp. NPDC046385]